MSNKTMTRKSQGAFLPGKVFNDFLKPWNDWFGNDEWERALTIPAVNITEDEKNYKLSVAAPGLNKDDFKIELHGNLLTIGAEKEESTEDKHKEYNRQEYNYSSFSRTFTLPEEVKQDAIDAVYKDGVLNLTLPKNGLAAKNSKTVKVK